MNYDHFDYCKKIFDDQEVIKNFYKSFGIEDLLNMEEKSTNSKGPIFVAVDASEKEFQTRGSTTISKSAYAIILGWPTKTNDSNTIYTCKEEATEAGKQLILKLLTDPSLLMYLDKEEIKMGGFGPFGRNYIGVIISYSLTEVPTTKAPIWHA